MSVLGKVLDVTGDVAGAWLGNKSSDEDNRHSENVAVHEQHASEYKYRGKKNIFDSFVDGMSRLVRPIFTYGVVGIITWASWGVTDFLEWTARLATIPQPLWIIFGTIIAFWFGSRSIFKDRVKFSVNAGEVKNLREEIEKLRGHSRPNQILTGGYMEDLVEGEHVEQRRPPTIGPGEDSQDNNHLDFRDDSISLYNRVVGDDRGADIYSALNIKMTGVTSWNQMTGLMIIRRFAPDLVGSRHGLLARINRGESMKKIQAYALSSKVASGLTDNAFSLISYAVSIMWSERMASQLLSGETPQHTGSWLDVIREVDDAKSA